MLDSVSTPIPVEKKCRSCRQVKLLVDFDFSQRSKNKRAQICKDCKEQKQYQDQICTCDCTSCDDGRLFNSAYYLLESILSRCQQDQQVPEQFRELVMALATTLLDQEEEENKNND